MNSVTFTNYIESKLAIFTDGGAYYVQSATPEKIQTYDSAPGPRMLSGINLDDGADRFFLLYVEDCAFPSMYVVSGSSFEDAYDTFIEMRAEDLRLDDEEVRLLQEQESDIHYSDSGVPVDTDGIQGHEVQLVAIFTQDDDRTFWNMMCMLAANFTRYDNTCVPERRAMITQWLQKACTTEERATERFKAAGSLGTMANNAPLPEK